MSEILTAIQPTSELRSERDGRLNAVYIARYLDVSQDDIALILGVSLRQLKGNPTATSIQPALVRLESVIESLKTLVGGKEAARAWLNLSLKQLEGKTPLEAMKEGYASVVAEMLEDMMIGQPS